mmetsp:Transcript_20113/g.65505  ORF Transcript_20113/g.65505 Transcript_20113/m.65505 type:complete len:201 (-) Transcript_20113:374-976(-)
MRPTRASRGKGSCWRRASPTSARPCAAPFRSGSRTNRSGSGSCTLPRTVRSDGSRRSTRSPSRGCARSKRNSCSRARTPRGSTPRRSAPCRRSAAAPSASSRPSRSSTGTSSRASRSSRGTRRGPPPRAPTPPRTSSWLTSPTWQPPPTFSADELIPFHRAHPRNKMHIYRIFLAPGQPQKCCAGTDQGNRISSASSKRQ